MIGIYMIKNVVNNKVYIGQSRNISKRWRQHRYLSNIEDNYLYRAIRKYGIENFTFSVIEECSIENLNKREEYWISYYDSTNRENGYNILSSSQNDGTYSRKLSNEEYEKVIYLLMNTTSSQEEIAKQFNIDQSVVSRINTGDAYIKENLIYPIRKIKQKENVNYCIKCGKPISKKAFKCRKCFLLEKQNANCPNREELKLLIRDFPFTKIGEKFNVTDNAVRKWCDKYNLPRTKKEINSYSEEEWNKI